MGGLCVPHTSVAHCTAAADSVCTACAFSHRPTPSNTAHEAHAVWFVVFFIVVVGLIVIAVIVVCFVVLVDRIMREVRVANQRETTCIFEMSLSDLTFESARHGSDVVLNKHVVVFEDGAVLVGVVSKEPLCVGNRGRSPMTSLLRRGRTTSSLSGQARAS